MSRQVRTSGDRRSKRNINEKVEKFLENEREDYSGHSYDDAPSPKLSHARARRRWTISEELSRPSREPKDDDSEEDSLDAKKTQKPGRSNERNRMREKHRNSFSNDHEVDLAEKRKRSRHTGRRKKVQDRSRQPEDELSQDEDVPRSSKKFHGDPDGPQKSRRKRESTRGDKEVPITEILRRSQENARVKYEEPVPLPQLTTDTIYVQGKNGFSAVRISATKSWRRSQQTTRKGRRGRKSPGIEDTQIKHPHITAAIFAQKLWKRTGIVFQGLLGGMAFLHFIMLQFLFSASLEFVREYSTLSEIYGSLFSLLIGLCVVSIFDKFDLARLDVDHAREIYGNHAKSALAVPLYVAAFALHQTTSRVDDWLALSHYQNVNGSVWANETSTETFLQELITWQRLTTSQDLMAVFAWFFVSLGTRDDMLLMHLESMEKYANSIETN